MAILVNSFDYFKRGEVFRTLQGKTTVDSFDYFRRGEPAQALYPLSAPVNVSSSETTNIADAATLNASTPTNTETANAADTASVVQTTPVSSAETANVAETGLSITAQQLISTDKPMTVVSLGSAVSSGLVTTQSMTTTALIPAGTLVLVESTATGSSATPSAPTIAWSTGSYGTFATAASTTNTTIFTRLYVAYSIATQDIPSGTTLTVTTTSAYVSVGALYVTSAKMPVPPNTTQNYNTSASTAGAGYSLGHTAPTTSKNFIFTAASQNTTTFTYTPGRTFSSALAVSSATSNVIMNAVYDTGSDFGPSPAYYITQAGMYAAGLSVEVAYAFEGADVADSASRIVGTMKSMSQNEDFADALTYTTTVTQPSESANAADDTTATANLNVSENSNASDSAIAVNVLKLMGDDSANLSDVITDVGRFYSVPTQSETANASEQITRLDNAFTGTEGANATDAATVKVNTPPLGENANAGDVLSNTIASTIGTEAVGVTDANNNTIATSSVAGENANIAQNLGYTTNINVGSDSVTALDSTISYLVYLALGNESGIALDVLTNSVFIQSVSGENVLLSQSLSLTNKLGDESTNVTDLFIVLSNHALGGETANIVDTARVSVQATLPGEQASVLQSFTFLSKIPGEITNFADNLSLISYRVLNDTIIVKDQVNNKISITIINGDSAQVLQAIIASSKSNQAEIANIADAIKMSVTINANTLATVSDSMGNTITVFPKTMETANVADVIGAGPSVSEAAVVTEAMAAPPSATFTVSERVMPYDSFTRYDFTQGTSTTDEFWSFDGVSLNSPAWNITTVGGSRYGLPAMRGDNVQVAQRPGRIFVPKVADSRVITLIMWMVAIDPATGLPPNRNQSIQWNDNWNYLRKLFYSPAKEKILTRRWKLNASSPRIVVAEARAQLGGTMDPNMTGRTRAEFSVDLVLADPFFYGKYQSSAAIQATLRNDLTNSHPTVVNNPGDDQAGVSHFVVKLYGRLINPRLVNMSGANGPVWFKLSNQLSAAQIAAGTTVPTPFEISTGDTMLVDVEKFLARLQSTGSRYTHLITHSGATPWLILEPGDNVFYLEADAGSTGYAVITWRAPYL